MKEELENKLLGFLQGSLTGLALILFGYLFYQIFLVGHPSLAFLERFEDPQNFPEAKKAVSGQDPQEESFLKNGRSWDEYRNQIQKRDLFKASLEEKKDSQDQNVVNLSQIIKDLKLVGILLDQRPQAMIKDLKTNQTMFLNQGQQIDGVTVAEILEGKVILNYQDQKTELVQ